MTYPAHMRARVAVVAAALALTGCTGTTGSTSTTGTTPSLAPSADPLTNAVETTASLGTARVTLGASSRVGDDPELRVAGSGTVDLSDAQGYLVLRVTGGTEGDDVGILVNDEGGFVSDDGGASWAELAPRQQAPFLAAVDPLRGLAGLGSLATAEEAVVDGLDATRYDAELPTDSLDEALVGFGIATELGDWEAPVLRLSAWVDDAGRVVRVERTLTATTEAGALAATSITALSDFGAPIDLRSPTTPE